MPERDARLRTRPPVPASVRLAGWVLVAEAAGLCVLAVVDLVKVATGTPRSAVYAIVAAALTLATAAALLVLARAVRRLSAWAYAPTIVVQLLALPVGYSLAVQAGVWVYGGPVLLLAIAELVALVVPSSRRALGPG